MPEHDAVTAAKSYLQQEPSESLRKEVETLLEQSEAEDVRAIELLTDRFLGHLSFGTAGLRAKMESGFTRLNLVTVAKAAYAIGAYAKECGGETIILGYDARNNSQEFAKEAASVLRGAGLFVYEFDAAVATPICAFGVKHFGVSAGIIITASHNPPSDNGMKVYGANGAQIVSPSDREIEGKIQSSPDYDKIPRSPMSSTNGCIIDLEKFLSHYISRIQEFKINPDATRKGLKIVYTPLHGVGYRFLAAAIGGDPNIELVSVTAQEKPDGRFPTLKLPNPEEDGALDLAICKAQAVFADLIVANDPDADRLAVAAVKNAKADYTMLSGNEMGAILGCDILENFPTTKKKLVVSTLVSSRQLSAIAQACNASYAESLTGFSKIAQIALEREARLSEQFVFGFEEALGYCVGSAVYDKDGISAAMRLMDRAALLKAQGMTIWDELDRISLKYGLFRNRQWSQRYNGLDSQNRINEMMNRLRDLKAGDVFFDSGKISSKHDLLVDAYEDFPSSNIILFYLDDTTRVIVRPSGTEPKVKFYAENSTKSVSKENLVVTRDRLDQRLNELCQKVVSSLERV